MKRCTRKSRCDLLARPTILCLATLVPAVFARAAPPPWSFTDATASAGFNYQHGFADGTLNDIRRFVGGVACGDYNNDGFTDIYVVRGTIGPNLLFRNAGNGTFQEVGAAAGVNVTNSIGCGPAFADFSGDGWPDLIIGGVEGTTPRLFRNNGNGTFQDVSLASGVYYARDTYSCAFGDADRDGDLDLFMTHWGAPQYTGGHFWRNNGNGTFSAWDSGAGFTLFGDDINEYTYTASFADINSDRWPDVLIASDFNTSEIYVNDGDGTFTNATTSAIDDQFGMGSAAADYDNDGDLDWFVTSIWDTINEPEPGFVRDGNRLYRNDGAGSFVDVTNAAGVRHGYWGWAASFSDFNNDGWLDLYHVNGYKLAPHDFDPARMFVATGAGNFAERSAELGVADTRQGRGLAVFDFDRDGDLDIFIANNNGPPSFYRNDGGNSGAYATVRLRGDGLNTEAIGARVIVTAGGVTRLREIHAGSNYASQNPAEAHFGLGNATSISVLRIEWPSGAVDVFNDLPVNRFMTFEEGHITSVVEPAWGDPSGSIAALGAYPNPAPGAAAIRVSSAAPLPVTLRLFDGAGRWLRTIEDSRAITGPRELVWDGRDRFERRVAAGSYFYSVECREARALGRVTIVR